MKHTSLFPLLTMMTSLVITCGLLLTSSEAEGLEDLCPDICHRPEVYALLAPKAVQRCHCVQTMQHTTKAPTTTTDICDYLCSIQLGGQACECSRPSLPGRK